MIYFTVDVTPVVDAPPGAPVLLHLDVLPGDRVSLTYSAGGPQPLAVSDFITVVAAADGSADFPPGDLGSVTSVVDGRCVTLSKQYTASIGLGGTSSAGGSSSGDPYVQSLRLGGRVTKLPDRAQSYRLRPVRERPRPAVL